MAGGRRAGGTPQGMALHACNNLGVRLVLPDNRLSFVLLVPILVLAGAEHTQRTPDLTAAKNTWTRRIIAIQRSNFKLEAAYQRQMPADMPGNFLSAS